MTPAFEALTKALKTDIGKLPVTDMQSWSDTCADQPSAVAEWNDTGYPISNWGIMLSDDGDDGIGETVIQMTGANLVCNNEGKAFIEFAPKISYPVGSETEKVILEGNWRLALQTAAPDIANDVIVLLDRLGLKIDTTLRTRAYMDEYELVLERVEAFA